MHAMYALGAPLITHLAPMHPLVLLAELAERFSKRDFDKLFQLI